ncbi:MAG: hydrolase 1, exosortase A system-associated [Rhodospirillaceae bacterium]
MKVVQQAIVVPCGRELLVAVLTRPSQAISRGVLIVVGGPQYRAGSHRQFKLLADYLAERRIPVMRFDYRGMGDSTGEARSFEDVAPDLRAAVDVFFENVGELREVIVWGLCDAASAALLYCNDDRRITGLVLLNPWIRTAGSEANVYLKHYYAQRLFTGALWRKVIHGEFDARASLNALVTNVREATRNRAGGNGSGQAPEQHALPERMADGFARFKGRVLLILSGNDLTAKEFSEVTAKSTQWGSILDAPRVTRRSIAGATHTFSRREWRDQVAAWTDEWLRSW